MKDKKMTQNGRTQTTPTVPEISDNNRMQIIQKTIGEDQMKSSKRISLLLALLLTIALLGQSFQASVWPQKSLDALGQTATDANTPKSEEEAALVFQLAAKEADNFDSLSNVILADNSVYIAIGSTLRKYDKQGQLAAQAEFSGLLQSWTASLLYHEGYIYGFVSDGTEGYLEAIRTSDMTVAWRSNGISGQEAYSALVLADDTIYMTTNAYDADAWGPGAPGNILSLSLTQAAQSDAQPELNVLFTSEQDVFSSNSPTVSDEYLYLGTQAGSLLSIHLETGDAQRLDTEKPIKTGLTLVDNTLYFGNTEGIMQVGLDAQGLPDSNAVRQYDLGLQVTTVPLIYQNLMFAGTGDFMGGQGLAVIDLAVHELLYTAKMPGIDFYGETIESAGVQSQPLLTMAYDDAIYVYYAYNAKPGGLYVLRHQPGQTKDDLTLLFEPDEAMQNSTMSAITADETGNLYYTNDSGYLFAVGFNSAGTTDPEDTTDVTDPEDTTDVTDPEDTTDVTDPEDTTDVTDPEEPTESENPDTGRQSSYLWLSLFLLAAALVVSLLRYHLKSVQANLKM